MHLKRKHTVNTNCFQYKMPGRNQISEKYRNQRDPVKNRGRTNKTSGRNAGNNLKTNPGAAKLMVDNTNIEHDDGEDDDDCGQSVFTDESADNREAWERSIDPFYDARMAKRAKKAELERLEAFWAGHDDVEAGIILAAEKAKRAKMFKLHTWKKYSLEAAIDKEMQDADAILAANAAKKAVDLKKAAEMEIIREKWLLRQPMTPIERCEYLHWAAAMARS